MPKRSGKISLEQLLAAKRRERPSPEFWEGFQRELRIKERRMLQRQQPIENRELERAIWPRFRKSIALACATVSCGTFGFIILQSAGPSIATNPEISTQSLAKVELANDAPELPHFAVAETPAPATETKAFLEVADTPEVISTVGNTPTQQTATVSTSNPVEIAETTVAEPSFTLDIPTPFEEIDIEKAIAFNEPSDRSASFARSYIDPLTQVGYRSRNVTVAYRSDISQVSARALDSGIIDRDSRWGLRLDEVKLKF